MSDTPNEALPDWLAKSAPETAPTPAAPAFSLAAPPEAVAAAIATEPEPLTDEAVRQNGLPLPEVSPIETAAVADVLIKFKRFWNAADNTSNELDAALECAKYFVWMMQDADKSK